MQRFWPLKVNSVRKVPLHMKSCGKLTTSCTVVSLRKLADTPVFLCKPIEVPMSFHGRPISSIFLYLFFWDLGISCNLMWMLDCIHEFFFLLVSFQETYKYSISPY